MEGFVARRGGKAASRRARRNPPRRPVIPQPGLARTTAAEPPAEAAPAAPTREDRPERRPEPTFHPVPGASSALGERGRAEYHYVVRDLRNIAVLTALMAVFLVAAWLALPATGLIPT
jgi:hypothetical protein